MKYKPQLRKIDMALVVVQALYNLKELPNKYSMKHTHYKKTKSLMNLKKEDLQNHYNKAHKILTDSID